MLRRLWLGRYGVRQQPAFHLLEMGQHGSGRAGKIAFRDGIDDARMVGEAVMIGGRPGAIGAQAAPDDGAPRRIEHIEKPDQQGIAARLGDLTVQEIVERFILAP